MNSDRADIARTVKSFGRHPFQNYVKFGYHVELKPSHITLSAAPSSIRKIGEKLLSIGAGSRSVGVFKGPLRLRAKMPEIMPEIYWKFILIIGFGAVVHSTNSTKEQ